MTKRDKQLILITSIGLIIVFFLLAVSVYQLNAYASEIYFIRNTEKTANQLSQENRILEADLAERNSFGNLSNYAQNFEKASRIEYVRILEGTVLAR